MSKKCESGSPLLQHADRTGLVYAAILPNAISRRRVEEPTTRPLLSVSALFREERRGFESREDD